MRVHFAHVETWVFDLDNTLYPPAARLFDQIEARMLAYLMRTLGVDAERAGALRAQYWREHGTTLAGLMREHGVDPEPYLAEVHDIDLTGMAPTPMRSIWLKIAAKLTPWPRPSFIWPPSIVAPRMFIEAKKSSRAE